MQILAATDFSTRSHRALRRAGLLAQARGAELALVHVVDDDQPKDLVEIERREAERILAEQIGAMAELRGVKMPPRWSLPAIPSTAFCGRRSRSRRISSSWARTASSCCGTSSSGRRSSG